MNKRAEPGTIFHISSTPWHFMWQSAQSTSTQFARHGWRVFYLDPIPKRIPRFREFRRVIGRVRGDPVQAGIVRQPQVAGITYVLPKALPDRGRLARWINHRVFLPALARQLLTQAGDRPFVAYATLATHASLDLLTMLQPDFLVYGCYLDPAHDPLAPKDAARTEYELACRANLIVVDDGLANQERIAAFQVRCPVLEAAKTVDYQHFEPARSLRTLDAPESAVCCYFGDIRRNVDVDLLRKVSQRFRLRLIGSQSVPLREFSPATEFVPPVSYADLPTYLRDVDIFLLPYRHDDPYNRAVAPAKTYICLATGKPTIASGLPSLIPLSGVIDMADDDAAFMALIERAVEEAMQPTASATVARREARLKKAQEHSEQAEFERWFSHVTQALGLDA